jgi:hypothetical protein
MDINLMGPVNQIFKVLRDKLWEGGFEVFDKPVVTAVKFCCDSFSLKCSVHFIKIHIDKVKSNILSDT